MKTIYALSLVILVSISFTSILAQDVDRPPGSTYCAYIIPTDGRPCVYTAQWNEWQIKMLARIELCYYGPEGKTSLTSIIAPVTWYRKFYGQSTYEYWTVSNTEEVVGSDGHRCKNGNPVHDRTWETTYKAVVNYQGVDYAAYLTVGGDAAENYPCCPGQNCNPPSPPPCE